MLVFLAKFKSRPRLRARPWRSGKGATLIELVIALAIVGILAAVAIPVVSGYVRNSKMSEAVSNIAGILEAEEAFFVRFQRYTLNLGFCPPGLPGTTSVNWPANPASSCNPNGNEWVMLGWKPDGAVLFRYRVFSAYENVSGSIEKTYHPASNPPAGMPAGFGIDWNTLPGTAGDLSQMPPWCAVEAEADTDGDGNSVFIRGNSINGKTFRTPEDEY